MRHYRPLGYAVVMTGQTAWTGGTTADGSGDAAWRPDHYRIQVAGLLGGGWTTWFEGLTVTGGVDESGAAVTTLAGEVLDQAQLHSILSRIRDLGLTLILVERVRPIPSQPGPDQGE